MSSVRRRRTCSSTSAASGETVGGVGGVVRKERERERGEGSIFGKGTWQRWSWLEIEGDKCDMSNNSANTDQVGLAAGFSFGRFGSRFFFFIRFGGRFFFCPVWRPVFL